MRAGEVQNGGPRQVLHSFPHSVRIQCAAAVLRPSTPDPSPGPVSRLLLSGSTTRIGDSERPPRSDSASLADQPGTKGEAQTSPSASASVSLAVFCNSLYLHRPDMVVAYSSVLCAWTWNGWEIYGVNMN